MTFHCVCSSCFSPVKPNPSAIASVCVSDRASRRNLQHCNPPSCAGIPKMSESQGRCAFADFHLEHFTHQLFEIVRPVIWNAEDEIVSPVHTKCFQRGAPIQTPHHRISLKALIVDSFLHARRKHLTRVISSVKTLEQSPDLPLLAKVLRWYHVDHLAHFPMEERYRNVKHSNDHRRVCTLGLVARCPTQDQSHELQKWGCRKRVRSRFACVTSVAHNRHRIVELFGSFRVSIYFDQISLPGVDRISDSSTSILTSNSSNSRTSFGTSLSHFF